MRVVVEHRCRRLDLGPVERLVPALVAEWTGLGFGPDGRVLSPSGAADDRLRLTGGRHDHPRAAYEVVVPDDDGTQERFAVRLEGVSAGGDRRDLEVGPVGPGPDWSAQVRLADLPRGPLDKARLPSGSGSFELGVRSVAEQEEADAPRWALALLTFLVGRRLRVEAEVDPAVLATPAPGTRRLLSGSGRCGAWRADLDVDVRAGEDWEGTVTLEVAARGPARLVLAVVGARRVERWLRQAVDSVAGPQALDEHERDLARTARGTDEAGGPVPYVRSLLWGSGQAVVGGPT